MRKMLLLLILLTGLSPAAWAVTVTTTHQTIPSWDGTPLGVFVIQPQGQGEGRLPLLVMPSSWAVPSVEYVGVAQALAQRGYIVLSYSSRGFWESGGAIDIAGPATVEDVSALIDWALDNTRADPARIGVSGISYGAGTSLLAAARDPRIKAVAALSGWADLQAALYSNNTPSAQGIALLVAAGLATGRPGEELATINRRVVTGNFQGAVESLLPVAALRSPSASVAEINANRPAIFLANAFNDSLFPPGQLVDFFNALTGPKQLQLRHGDHALNEALGALGVPNEVYASVGDWFDHYLKGVANGIDRAPAVQLKSQKGSWNTYADWQATRAGATQYALTAPGGLLLPTGGLVENGRSSGWSYRIGSGLPTAANSGVAMVSGSLQMINVAPGAYVPFIGRNAAGVWQSPVYWSARRLDGMPEVRVTVTPSRADTTLYAYLFVEDVLGNGQLISHKPYTLRSATPGQASTLDLRLEASSWNIPAGSRLTLVIDTVDLRYAGVSQLGGTVTFSSPANAPSVLRVPLH
ncbi:CocE/NonD family hydrolase [Stenotrophomonas maltophilia]|uniref:S15 peptidase family protein n=1 Tax=Stenotrophomonas TaxID=40323 RepID=UPI000DA6DF16|nr:MULTISPECIES: CocE/NonD family hydrolase [Stenotrophomonas]MBE5269398.1 CocE/NonD family hydrolase [Stenotrophomonas sp. B2]MBH1834406.1 CocE/NonD family hydrolase [Stenotrophomonas maltophilia]MCO7397773.1 CocE/NonD family hydrolase [Stenotrophomonas maltophilia]MCO7409966.1 CocE/NonD family hydrolase [Stenotrophomonas maltophilia]MCU1020215.1 CocE/NonD family hydrolase [Stenotrophomonas maltophilia]